MKTQKTPVRLWQKLEGIKMALNIITFLLLVGLGIAQYLQISLVKDTSDNTGKYMVYTSKESIAQISELTSQVQNMEKSLEEARDSLEYEKQESRFQEQRADQQTHFINQWAITNRKAQRLNQSILDSITHSLHKSMQQQAALTSMLTDSAFAHRFEEMAKTNFTGTWRQNTPWFDVEVALFKGTKGKKDSLAANPTVYPKNKVTAKVIEKKKSWFSKTHREIEVVVESANPHLDPPKQTFTAPFTSESAHVKRIHIFKRRPKGNLKMAPGYYGTK